MLFGRWCKTGSNSFFNVINSIINTAVSLRRRKEEDRRYERRASSHELREGRSAEARRGSSESVRKVQSEVNVRGEKLLPGRRLATAVPRYKGVIKGLGNEILLSQSFFLFS